MWCCSWWFWWSSVCSLQITGSTLNLSSFTVLQWNCLSTCALMCGILINTPLLNVISTCFPMPQGCKALWHPWYLFPFTGYRVLARGVCNWRAADRSYLLHCVSSYICKKILRRSEFVVILYTCVYKRCWVAWYGFNCMYLVPCTFRSKNQKKHEHVQCKYQSCEFRSTHHEQLSAAKAQVSA